MKRQLISLSLLFLLWCAGATAEAIIKPVYRTFSFDGFNAVDPPHALSREQGNPGSNLGEQRRWAFERALNFWASRLDSNIVIQVATQMEIMSCDSYSALLASAGPGRVLRDWTRGNPPPFANTWYAASLANKIANRNLSEGSIIEFYDITSIFNDHIDRSDFCLGSHKWYYALGEAPPGTVSFITTAIHEIGHGLGFLTVVNLADGSRLDGYDDVYMKFLEDHSTGKLWPDMTDTERATSALNTSNLHWVGSNVLEAIGSLSDGVSNGHVQMYAPNPAQGGSSVSHWDDPVRDHNNNRDIMGPNAVGSEKLLVTGQLLHDIGWNDVEANNCTFSSNRLLLSSWLEGNNTHNACVSVTYDGATIISGHTSATAGSAIILKNGFRVEQGATFGVNTDPGIGL